MFTSTTKSPGAASSDTVTVSATVSSGVVSVMKQEKCLFGKSQVDIPEPLTENLGLFTQIISADTWRNALSDTHRRHLLKFLPKFPSNDVQEKQDTLRQLFTCQNFKFGTPVKQFHKRLREGMFSPDIARFAELVRMSKLREYRYQQQVYYECLLKEILINREEINCRVLCHGGKVHLQRILVQVRNLSPADPLMFSFEHYVAEPQKPNRNLAQKVSKKYRRFIKQVNQECGQDDTSSDEEDTRPEFKGKKQHLKSLCPDPATETIAFSVQGTLQPRPLPITNGDALKATTDGNAVVLPLPVATVADVKHVPLPKRSVSPMDITEEDYREMLYRHKRRRLDGEEHPELETRGIVLEDVVSRAQMGKKPMKSQLNLQKKKLKERKKKPMKASSEEGSMDGSTVVANTPAVNAISVMLPPDDNAQDGMSDVEDSMDAYPVVSGDSLPKIQNYSQYSSFFVLLRDMILEESEGRITTVKAEEKVREWQESATALLNDWFGINSNWVELVPAALKFLSGDVLGLSLDHFIPYLDYKERAQQWKWIGEGRDGDEELGDLCRHWLDNRDGPDGEAATERASSPPPPRVKTDYSVAPTTDDEKTMFRKQEEQRFGNPHRGFTYYLHGYESVVGPVKGVYTKDNAMNKAREHALLVQDRPPYVTILTLVRDAAARLPNGEGTRSHICELLRDSQFIAPGVSDAQINTVVSGALDRLHYEKDPCVKYDVNRKLWIYLHRCRSEDEFEKIHQAQGAAAKAKKALQKPKQSKRIKETIAPMTVAMTLPSPITAATNVTVTATDTVVSQKVTGAAARAARTPQSTAQVTSLTSSPRQTAATLTHLQSPKTTAVSSISATTVSPSTTSKLSTMTTGLNVQLAGNKASQVSTQARPVTVSMVTAQRSTVQTATTQATELVSHPTTSSGKPVAFNFIHSGNKIESVLPLQGQQQQQQQQQAQVRTQLLSAQHGVLPPTKTETITKASTIGALQQQLLASGHKSGHVTVATPVTASLSSAARPVVATSPLTAITNKPVLTRIVQAGSVGQQMMLGNITMASNVAQKHAGQTPTTIKIQGSSLVHGSTTADTDQQSKTVTLQRVQSLEGRDSKPSTPTGEQPHIPPATITLTPVGSSPLVQVGRGGKPATVMLTKSGGAAGTKVRSASTTQTVAQVLQSAALSGKPATYGGKPIIIGGKPLQIGGKPLQIGGKPVQVIGKPGQIGVLQGQLTGQGSLMSALNIITQVPAGLTSTQALPSKAGSHPATNLVSQILQSGAATVPHVKQLVSGIASKPSTSISPITSSVTNTNTTQTRPMVPGNIMVTQLPHASVGGATAVTQTRPGTSLQTGLSATQIIMQASQGGNRLVTPQQLLAGAGMRHGIMAAPGGKPQNIQLVKTMLSQPGGKPGQTTILLAQPGGQPATMLASSTDSLTQAIRTVNVSQANAKNKGAPVYARIITPRPCMRLAAVRPGQLQQCQVNQAQNISVLQAINRLQAPVDGQPQVVTLTTQPAPSPAPAQPKPPEHMQTDP